MMDDPASNAVARGWDIAGEGLEDHRQILRPSTRPGEGLVDVLSGVLILTEASEPGKHIGKLGAQAQMGALVGVSNDQMNRLEGGGFGHLTTAIIFCRYAPTLREALTAGLEETQRRGIRVHTIQAVWFRQKPMFWGASAAELRALAPGAEWVGLPG